MTHIEMLLTRNRAGDRKRADQLQASATATYDDLGLLSGHRPVHT